MIEQVTRKQSKDYIWQHCSSEEFIKTKYLKNIKTKKIVCFLFLKND